MAVEVYARNDLAWVEDRARALQNEMWRNRSTLDVPPLSVAGPFRVRG